MSYEMLVMTFSPALYQKIFKHDLTDVNVWIKLFSGISTEFLYGNTNYSPPNVQSSELPGDKLDDLLKSTVEQRKKRPRKTDLPKFYSSDEKSDTSSSLEIPLTEKSSPSKIKTLDEILSSVSQCNKNIQSNMPESVRHPIPSYKARPSKVITKEEFGLHDSGSRTESNESSKEIIVVKIEDTIQTGEKSQTKPFLGFF